MARIYNTRKLEIIKDIYGESCYVVQMIAAPKHGIKVFYGRPVACPVGGHQVIVTPELADFVKNTLHLAWKEFDLPFGQGLLRDLRHSLQYNPYKTYQKWLENPERPPYVTFDRSQGKLETIDDHFGQKHTLYSAEMTALSIPLLKGIAQYNNDCRLSTKPRFIITPELFKLLIEYRMKPQALLDLMPMLKPSLRGLRNRLGHNLLTDRNRWFAERVDDLITLTPFEFSKQHQYVQSGKVTSTVAIFVKAVLAMQKSGLEKDAQFLSLLESNWLIENKTTKKEMNKYCNQQYKPDQFRRAYQILKLAHRI